MIAKFSSITVDFFYGFCSSLYYPFRIQLYTLHMGHGRRKFQLLDMGNIYIYIYILNKKRRKKRAGLSYCSYDRSLFLSFCLLLRIKKKKITIKERRIKWLFKVGKLEIRFMCLVCSFCLLLLCDFLKS